MWWDEQPDRIKDEVRRLIKNGQLEFLNGGWSMHDEACPTFNDMINNMMIGHQFLLEEFGVKPRIGWSIDPFGHSNTNVRLFSEMGFDAWFIARIDYKDKIKRKENKELEFVWRPNADSLGTDTSLFTHVMYQHYSSPVGFEFDQLDNSDWTKGEQSLVF